MQMNGSARKTRSKILIFSWLTRSPSPLEGGRRERGGIARTTGKGVDEGLGEGVLGSTIPHDYFMKNY